MDNSTQKYEASTRANFTEEELGRAKANWDYASKRFPDEQAQASALIDNMGLKGHREVTSWYARTNKPIPLDKLGVIGVYKDSSYVGPWNRGDQSGKIKRG